MLGQGKVMGNAFSDARYPEGVCVRVGQLFIERDDGLIGYTPIFDLIVASHRSEN